MKSGAQSISCFFPAFNDGSDAKNYVARIVADYEVSSAVGPASQQTLIQLLHPRHLGVVAARADNPAFRFRGEPRSQIAIVK